MAGRRLRRKANSCRVATSKNARIADHARTSDLRLAAIPIPTAEAKPTIRVIAISVGEKVPETICTQPSRKSQIAIITSSQKRKHGSAVHFVKVDWRVARKIVIQSGEV
jgi:hypothetical protein